MTALARLGEFFAVDDAVVGRGWHPIAELVDGPFVDHRVVATHLVLRSRSSTEVEPRVAASIASLGLFARVLSPTIGALLLDVEAPTDLHWQERSTGTFPLAAGGWGPPDLTTLLSDVVEPVAARLHTDHGLSEQVLAGNASSAVFGALTMATLARPDLRDAALDVGVEALTHPYLAGTGDPGPPYVRSSCCLYYRIPGGGYCGDCVIPARGR